MVKLTLLSVTALIAALAVASPGRAQQAAAPSAPLLKMPFDIPYGEPIGLERAKQVIAAAEAEATKRGWKMTVCVTDTHGDLVALDRMDGAMLASVTVAPAKAHTAARWRRDTRAFFSLYDSGKAYIGTLDPQLTAAPGGIPLTEGGKMVGAIGASGGTGDQDEIIAKAGAAAFR